MSLLSVVVTVVDAGAALERCLAALEQQRDAPRFEVLVPWDSTVDGIEQLAARFADFRFVAMGRIWTGRSATSAAGRHELIDRRRAVGLASARGDLVALLEDRGVPRPDWVRELLAEHERHPHTVIGGPVEIARPGRLAWAAYACDFGRYQPPLTPGPRAYVTDVNVSYERRALESTRELWRERYQETTVHWALARAGETLYLSDRFVVDEMRDGLTFGALLEERFAAGRFFAATRARISSWGWRLLHALLSPLLPLLLLWRYLVERRGAGRRRPLVGTAGLLALLAVASSLGELVGEITGRD